MYSQVREGLSIGLQYIEKIKTNLPPNSTSSRPPLRPELLEVKSQLLSDFIVELEPGAQLLNQPPLFQFSSSPLELPMFFPFKVLFHATFSRDELLRAASTWSDTWRHIGDKVHEPFCAILAVP
jgi:hypothetical protein